MAGKWPGGGDGPKPAWMGRQGVCGGVEVDHNDDDDEDDMMIKCRTITRTSVLWEIFYCFILFRGR